MDKSRTKKATNDSFRPLLPGHAVSQLTDTNKFMPTRQKKKPSNGNLHHRLCCDCLFSVVTTPSKSHFISSPLLFFASSSFLFAKVCLPMES